MPGPLDLGFWAGARDLLTSLESRRDRPLIGCRGGGDPQPRRTKTVEQWGCAWRHLGGKRDAIDVLRRIKKPGKEIRNIT
jgi:hypothetical protein